MPFCSNCGAQNNETTKFCTGCGKELNQTDATVNTKKTEANEIEKAAENFIATGSPELSNIEEVPLAASVLSDSSNMLNPMAVSTPQKSINKKPIMFAAAVIVIAMVLFGVGVAAKNFITGRDPLNHTVTGLTKTLTANSSDTTTTVKLKLSTLPQDAQSQMIGKMVEDFSIKVDSKMDKALNKSLVNMSILYKDQNFLQGTAYVDKNMLVFSVPSLYKDPMYIKIDELNKLSNQDAKPFQYENYKSLLNVKNNKNFKAISKDYSKFNKDNFGKLFTKGEKSVVVVNQNGNSVSVKCDDMTLSFTDKDLTEILTKLLLKIADDKNVKLFVKEKAEEFFALAEKNNDLEKLKLTKEDIKDFRNNYDKEYDKFTKELKESMDLSDLSNTASFNTKVHFRFDSKNYLRNLHIEATVKPAAVANSVGVNLILDQVVNSINSKVDISTPSITSAKDMSKMTEDDLEIIQQSIQEKFMQLLGGAGL